MKPPKRESIRDLLDAQVLEYHEKVRNWSELPEDVSLPADFAAALVTGRSELLKIVTPRTLSVDECRALYHAFGVMIEHNMLLRRHCEEVAKITDNMAGTIAGVQSVIRQIQQFANFKTIGAGDSEE